MRSEHWVNAISCWMALRWDDDNPAVCEDDWEWESGGWDGGDECAKLCPSMPSCLEVSRHHMLLLGMGWDGITMRRSVWLSRVSAVRRGGRK